MNYFFVLLFTLLLNLAFADLSSLDSTLAVGGSARSMGMGGMYVNIAGDPANIFGNPAGLAGTDKVKYFLMGTKTLQEVDYLMGGIIFPVRDIGYFGVGIVDRKVGSIPFNNGIQLDASGQIDFNNYQDGSYAEDIFIISYANRMRWWERNINYGFNFKYYQYTTTNWDKGNASAVNMDIGGQMELNRDILLGAKLQNFLSSRSGSATLGSLLWDTGQAEVLDSTIVLGIANKTIYRNLLLGLDFRKSLSSLDYPWTIQFGAEWHPHDALFFRLGMRQKLEAPDLNNSGDPLAVVNSYSAGVGINLYGWRFDYAYLPDSAIKDLTSHVFSISYVGPEPAEKELSIEGDLVTYSPLMMLLQPADRSVTDAVGIKVKGRITQGKRYILNDEEYEIARGNEFTRDQVLALGINDVSLTLPGLKQKLVHKVLRLAKFDDINKSPAKKAIVNLATLGYIRGDYPRKFNPTRYVTRAEMAGFIIKINRLLVPVAMKGIWEDVDILASKGILKGFPDGLMRADAKLTKAQVALVLARLNSLKDTDNLDYGYMREEHWANGAVQSLLETKLYTTADFSPKNGYVTKEELVELFARLPLVQRSVDKMLNFDETGVGETAPEEVNSVFMRRSAIEQKRSDQDAFQEMLGSEKSAPPAAAAALSSPVPANDEQAAFLADIGKLENSTGSVNAVPVADAQSSLKIEAPQDQMIVYGKKIIVKGTLPNNTTKLYINGQSVPIAKGAFNYPLLLKYSKNKVVLKAYDKAGKFTKAERKVLVLNNFSDLAAGDPDRQTLGALAALGYVRGDAANNFKPGAVVTKIQFAGMLNSVFNYNLPVNKPNIFKDLKASNPGFRNAYILHEKGIITADKGVYKPAAPLTKGKAELFIARAAQSGLPAGNDGATLTKKSAALLLAEIPQVKAKINNLLDWNKGY